MRPAPRFSRQHGRVPVAAAGGRRRLAVGDTGRALQLVDEELLIVDRTGTALCRGGRCGAKVLSSAGSEGLDLLDEAVGVLRSSPALLERSRALIDFGAALRRNNQRVKARQALFDGADLAQRLGAADPRRKGPTGTAGGRGETSTAGCQRDRRPDTERTSGCHPGRERAHQPPGCPIALHQRENRRRALGPHLRQVVHYLPRPGRGSSSRRRHPTLRATVPKYEGRTLVTPGRRDPKIRLCRHCSR